MITVRHLHGTGCSHASLDDVLADRADADDPGMPLDDVVARDRERLDADGWYWVDVEAPDQDEERVLERLGVHDLLEEDMREDRHLPKVELSGDQLLMVVHALRVRDEDDDQPGVATAELDVLMLPRLLVTWHRRPLPSLDALGDHLDRGLAGSVGRPIQLLHHLLDTITDVLIPFVDHFEQRLDIIEDDLLSTPTHATRDDLYRLQRDVIQLRRVVVPQAEVMRRVGREVEPLVDRGRLETADLARFRDIYDHLYRLAELSESYSQLLSSSLDTYRAAQDDELNDMLRVLTLVSALLLPISVLAGIWGTNFAGLPGATARGGFWIMMGGFALILATMGWWFRARGWIGRAAERDAVARRARVSDTLDVPVLGTILKIPVAGARTLGRGTRRLFHR